MVNTGKASGTQPINVCVTGQSKFTALQALTIACARAGFGDDPLGAAEEEALATLDASPAPFPEFSAALRQLAAREIPSIPTTVPPELQQLLAGIVEAIRKG